MLIGKEEEDIGSRRTGPACAERLIPMPADRDPRCRESSAVSSPFLRNAFGVNRVPTAEARHMPRACPYAYSVLVACQALARFVLRTDGNIPGVKSSEQLGAEPAP